ncbi:MAG: archaeal proteasome endopeptidase complex subunit alpha [Conexivisphaerales archaeon]
MFAPQAGYDRALTIFSPDGRLYQVEYAIETVRRGTLAVGIKCKEGVVLCAEEKVRKLQTEGLSQKLFQVDDHIGIAAAGYVPDARVLVDNARVYAQNNRLIYDEAVDVEGVARKLGDMAQQFTQYAGVRPFGVSLIIAGVDEQPAIFVTDPSGTYLGYDAVAIGGGSDQVNEFLEQNYKMDMTLEQAIEMAIASVKKAGEEKAEPKHIKVATIDIKTKKMRTLSEEEVNSYLAKVSGTKGQQS